MSSKVDWSHTSTEMRVKIPASAAARAALMTRSTGTKRWWNVPVESIISSSPRARKPPIRCRAATGLTAQ